MSGDGVDYDGVAEAFELGDAPCPCCWTASGGRCLVGLVSDHYPVGRDEHRLRDRDGRALGAALRRLAARIGQRAGAPGLGGRVRALDQLPRPATCSRAAIRPDGLCRRTRAPPVRTRRTRPGPRAGRPGTYLRRSRRGTPATRPSRHRDGAQQLKARWPTGPSPPAARRAIRACATARVCARSQSSVSVVRARSSPLTWCTGSDPSWLLGQAVRACRVRSSVTSGVGVVVSWERARTSRPR